MIFLFFLLPVECPPGNFHKICRIYSVVLPADIGYIWKRFDDGCCIICRAVIHNGNFKRIIILFKDARQRRLDVSPPVINRHNDTHQGSIRNNINLPVHFLHLFQLSFSRSASEFILGRNPNSSMLLDMSQGFPWSSGCPGLPVHK